jgi:hypothetical protein
LQVVSDRYFAAAVNVAGGCHLHRSGTLDGILADARAGDDDLFNFRRGCMYTCGR